MCVYICAYLSVWTYLLGREVSVSLCVCLFVGIYTNFRCPQRPEESIGSPGTGALVACEAYDMGTEK